MVWGENKAMLCSHVQHNRIDVILYLFSAEVTPQTKIASLLCFVNL